MTDKVLALIVSYLDALQRRRDWQAPASRQAWQKMLERYCYWVSPHSRGSRLRYQRRGQG